MEGFDINGPLFWNAASEQTNTFYLFNHVNHFVKTNLDKLMLKKCLRAKISFDNLPTDIAPIFWLPTTSFYCHINILYCNINILLQSLAPNIFNCLKIFPRNSILMMKQNKFSDWYWGGKEITDRQIQPAEPTSQEKASLIFWT